MQRIPALLAVVFLAATASAQGYRARVTEVHNGHTITVRDFVGRTELVRLEGVESPGRWRPFAAKSRESLRALVKHKQVTIIPRTHDRGRVTATVLIDDLDVGLEQLRRGLAWYDRDTGIREYEDAEAEAERERRGVWSRVR